MVWAIGESIVARRDATERQIAVEGGGKAGQWSGTILAS